MEELESKQAAIWQAIKDHFVIDNYPVSGPSFLLPNGDFIDLSSSYNSETSFEDFPVHVEVEDFLQSVDLSNSFKDSSGSPTIQELGAIRLNDLEYNNYIELSNVKPTSRQYEQLENWLEENSEEHSSVEVAIYHYGTYVHYDYEEVFPEEIIKRIKRYYSSGHLYEDVIEPNSSTKNCLNYVESNFNVSDYYSEGQSYILPNGEFLNLYDEAHIEVDDALYEKGLIKEDPYVSGRLVLMDEYNSIRLSDGKYIQTDPYVELPERLPSKAQLDSFIDFLDSLDTKQVWVGVRGNKNAGVSYNLENVLPEQIVKSIKKFYASGILYEAIEKAEDPRKKSFQDQIDDMGGDLKVTLYEAKNGHNYGAEYLEDLYRQNPSLCGKMLASIQIFKILKNATPTKYSKYLTHGIYELRASVATNEARELYFFSLGNEVFITNGFTKKSQKTPDQEIKKAERLMDEYNSFRRD